MGAAVPPPPPQDPTRAGAGPRRDSRALRFLRTVLAGSRMFILIPVFGSFIAAVALMIYGALAVVTIARQSFLNITDDLIVDSHDVEAAAIGFTQLIDIFLLGTVLYIVALGLYELFIDAELPLPGWLQITDLDELKEKLVGVVIVLLGVTFLGRIVSWDTGDTSILYLGLAVAAVVAALAAGLRLIPKQHREPKVDHHQEPSA